MALIHCRSCWQPMSAWARRCPRYGDIDKWRVRRAVAKLAIFLVVAAMVLGVVLWVR